MFQLVIGQFSTSCCVSIVAQKRKKNSRQEAVELYVGVLIFGNVAIKTRHFLERSPERIKKSYKSLEDGVTVALSADQFLKLKLKFYFDTLSANFSAIYSLLFFSVSLSHSRLIVAVDTDFFSLSLSRE
jgi:hypothetical protein